MCVSTASTWADVMKILYTLQSTPVEPTTAFPRIVATPTISSPISVQLYTIRRRLRFKETQIKCNSLYAVCRYKSTVQPNISELTSRVEVNQGTLEKAVLAP